MREHLTGQFTPGASILHRLDARAKFFGFLILIAATVCTDAWLGYVLLLTVSSAPPLSGSPPPCRCAPRSRPWRAWAGFSCSSSR